MPVASASVAFKEASAATRKLLWPFGVKKWLAAYLGLAGLGKREDPVVVELRRLGPYYLGTKLLATGSMLFILLGFLLPFSVIYVGLEGFFGLLIAYIVLMVALSLGGIVLEVGLDAVFGLGRDAGLGFFGALRKFFSVLRVKPTLVGGYVAIKLLLDMSIMTVVLAVFTPALLGLMAVMVYLIAVIRAGTDGRLPAMAGLLGVLALALLGFGATLLITVGATAFYGYYTASAVKMMLE